MTQWASGDSLTPSTLNRKMSSAVSAGGFSTNTVQAESGRTIRTASDIVLIDTASAASVAVHSGVVDGYFGVTLDQPSGYTAGVNGPAVNYRFMGTNKWGHNLEVGSKTTLDFTMLFDWSIPGDVFRASPNNGSPNGNKLIFGSGVGSPADEGACFTVASSTTVDAYAGRVSGNSELGMVLTNYGNSTAAGTRIKFVSGGDAGFGYVALYNSGHASRALNMYVGTSNTNPLVLSTNETPRISIGGDGLVNMTAARQSWRTVGASVSSSNLSANEVALFIGGASGASLCVRSGGTIYYFTSSASTVG